MPNRHVKVINGRKYYYESIRVGKKVTSRYLGPVERIRRKKAGVVIPDEQMQEQQPDGQIKEEIEELRTDESYIG